MRQLMHPVLAVAVDAAQAAAAMVRAAASAPTGLQIRDKGSNDFVTQVDEASQREIVRILLAAFPTHAVRGEESEALLGNPGAEQVWIVDPLDGTANFIHGYPAVAISVALAVRGRVEHGVVLDVVHGDVFHASLGRGAYCNTRRLTVAARPGLDGALLATSCPARPGPDFASALQMLGAVMARVAAIRRSGSAALDLAWTAAGYCDGSFDKGLNAWDVAAGGLLVSEAGGVVRNFGGGTDYLEKRECVAANPALAAALVAVLAPYGSTSQPA